MGRSRCCLVEMMEDGAVRDVDEENRDVQKTWRTVKEINRERK